MVKSQNTVQTHGQNRALSTKRKRETNYIESQIEDSENRNVPEFTNWNSPHANCDMLSRLPRSGIEENESDEEAEVFAMNMDDSFIDARLIARETKKDPILNY